MTYDAIRFRVASWEADASSLLSIRFRVFVQEQGVPLSIEKDGRDEGCLHVLAETPQGEAIGCGRLWVDGKSAKIGRMAVLPGWRSGGIGRGLLDRLLKEAQKAGIDDVFLSAQVAALDFYKRAGFLAEGGIYQEAEIPHQRMRLTFSSGGSPMSQGLRYLSGVQPSGQLHLGNYVGAIRKHIENQDNSFYFLANYHALTTVRDAEELRRNTFEAAITYLALGLDPERSVLFRQSDVPEVTELTWLLMTVTGMGLLERAVSYKEKKDRGILASAGLFTYPVLMAADILLYDTDVVPVGSDQIQHLEMTRDIAQTFNHTYEKDIFKLPRYELGVPTPVIGLDGAKMSKSYNNTIPIFARGKELKSLVMSIITDSTPLEAPKDPETCSVFKLYSLFATPHEVEALRAKYLGGNYGYGHAKKEFLGILERTFATAHDKRDHYLKHPSEVEDVLQEGARRARIVARQVLDRARLACGL